MANLPNTDSLTEKIYVYNQGVILEEAKLAHSCSRGTFDKL